MDSKYEETLLKRISELIVDKDMLKQAYEKALDQLATFSRINQTTMDKDDWRAWCENRK